MFETIRVKLEGWKTILFHSAAGLPAALYGLYLEFQSVDFTPVIPEKYLALVIFGMSVAGILLRLITTGPVGSKGTKDPSPSVKAGD